MPFIDIKQIENSYNEQPASYDWLWGVLLGFGLSFAQSEYQRYKDKSKVVELFEDELERLEPDFHRQLTSIQGYIQAIRNNSQTAALILILNHKFAFIKTLDIQILSRHYNRKKYLLFGERVKHKHYASEIMTNINVTEMQISELGTLHKVYVEQQTSLLFQYMAIMREISIKVTTRADNARLIAGRLTGYTEAVDNLVRQYFVHTNFRMAIVIELRDTFHRELGNIVSTDPLCLELTILNNQALALIGHLQTLDNQHLGYAGSLEEPIKEQFKKIYGKDL